MVKHIFVGSIKKGVAEEKVDEKINALRLLEENVPEIIQLTVGKNLGWYGTENAITLVADFKNKEDWNAFINNPYHVQLNAVASEVFDLSASTAAQIEF
ncbi:Dabb family protein [Clostridium sp. 19966]|uniref:Dabb family protein n=1 Tax=Clostridium sp. 19966 TaxID=2768166 RepID=UPI0028DED614|nr:Dabb family protein [Clostridium sp. 19966]MDT8716959.1 Dabb family protein [Clostridium sp. 19966]